MLGPILPGESAVLVRAIPSPVTRPLTLPLPMLPNSQACLATAARRLRYLRRFPQPFTSQASSPEIKLGMAMAYEYALRVLIDEFGAEDDFHALFYGPQSEDPEQCHALMSN